MRVTDEQRCKAIQGGGARCERKRYGDSIFCERHVLNPPEFVCATTKDLSLALGANPRHADRIQTRVEYLAGNKPKLAQ